jgi:GH25 family lysozyme M1 (1,4-beta-N-acetylmuramidase)
MTALYRLLAGAVAASLLFAVVPSAQADEAPAPGSQPTLEQQNAAHDHVMGATLGENEPQAQSLSAQAAPEARASAAPGTHVLGMDVSGWQPNVDWNAAWGNGARFVYIKTTESHDYASSHFAGQWSGASAVGMVRGAYHFANPFESTGAVQANWFVDHGGRWSPTSSTTPTPAATTRTPATGSARP